MSHAEKGNGKEMATATTNLDRVPPEARPVVAQAEHYGFTWKFIVNAVLPNLGKRIQIRGIGQPAPPREVQKIYHALLAGDAVPPLLTTRDGYLVDGNTRVGAAIKAGYATFDQVRLEVDYDGASPTMVRRLKILAGGVNNSHGLRMSTRDNEALILLGSQGEEYSAETLAAALHLSPNTVRNVMAARRARERAARLGVTLGERVTPSHLRVLGNVGRYSDKEYVEMASLVDDAGLTVAEFRELAKKIERVDNPDEKLAVIQAERESREDQIKGITRRLAGAAKLRRPLGVIIPVAENPGAYVEWNPKLRERHLHELETARRALDLVIAEQRAIEA